MKIIATFDTGNGPHELCASRDGRFVYAANYVFMEFIEGEERPKVTPDCLVLPG